MSLEIILFSIFCLIILFKADGGRKTSYPAAAGKAEKCPKHIAYPKEELLTTVKGKVISSHQKNICIGRVYGDSVSIFDKKGIIKNNDLFFADSDVLLNDLGQDDIILIVKEKSNGDKCYKLRCFDRYQEEDNHLYTKTSVGGVITPSKPHVLNGTIDSHGDKHKYLGCVVANISEYYKTANTEF